MVDTNFEFLVSQFTPSQKVMANSLMNNYRNQVDARKQITGKRQFILENVNPTALHTLISDSIKIIELASDKLQKNLDWIHWEFFVSEITGRVDGMVVCESVKVLQGSQNISDVKLVRFNPDAGRTVTVNMQKGIEEIKGDLPNSDPNLNVTMGNTVPYGLVLQCAATLPDSNDTYYQIDDMGHIELNDALQACYRALGQLHDPQSVERLADHIILMRSLKQLKYNVYQEGAFFDALHSLYNSYFRRKQAHDEEMRAQNRSTQHKGLTETEMSMRALMTPDNIHKAQKKLAYSLDKRNMNSDIKVIDFTAFQQARLNEEFTTMFEPDDPENW